MRFIPACIACVMSVSLVGCVIPAEDVYVVDDGPNYYRSAPPPPPHRCCRMLNGQNRTPSIHCSSKSASPVHG